MNELTLQIDGKVVHGNKGDTVMQVCERNDVFVPTLCHFKDLTNPGTCRMCSVEVQGGRGYTTACTTPAAEGMVVRTETPGLTELRRSILELLFAERNHFCMFCELSGDCELQALAYRYKIDHFHYAFLYPKLTVDSSHPNFLLDHNRCILCTRCVRACNQLVANDTLGLQQRGGDTMIAADLAEPIGDSSCVACGTCVQVCPTGALIDRRSAYGGKTSQATKTATVCPGCSLGCPAFVWSRSDRVLRIEGDLDSEVNRGLLCAQGRYAPLSNLPRRHDVAMVKRAGALVPAKLDDALGVVAKELTSRIKGGKTAAIAGVASPRATNEALYLFQKMFRTTLGNNNVMTAGDEGARQRSFNTIYRGAALSDVDSADHILLIGVDLAKSHQVLGFAVKRAIRRGVTVTLIAPPGNGLADLATTSLVPAQADYGVIVNGLVCAIIGAGLAKRALGNESQFLSGLEKYTAPAVAKRTGLPAGQIEAAAGSYARANAPLIILGDGDDGLEMAVLSLAALTGNYDGHKARVLRLGPQMNTRGAREMGASPAYLPGRVTWESPLAHRVSETWGVPLPEQRKAAAAEMLYILLVDETEPDASLLNMAKAAGFVVVQGAYHTALDDLADVVLPGPTWAEREGTITSADGTVQSVLPAARPPAGVKDDWAVLADLLGKLGGREAYGSAAAVYSEIVRLVPSYGDQPQMPAGAFTPACVDF